MPIPQDIAIVSQVRTYSGMPSNSFSSKQRPNESDYSYNVRSVAFSPDGQTIVSGSADKTVRLWDTKGNPIGQPFRGHESGVYSVAFSPDEQTIVSGGNDKTVRLWRGSWRAWLEVCCNRLRYHPVFKNPQTEVEKQACETCQKYVWSREES